MGGYSRSYINIYPSTNSTNFQQNLLIYKTFDFGNVSAYGQSISNVGSTFNDKFMEIRLVRYSSSEAIHYMGCEHDNWGGRRFIYTVTGNAYDVTLPIWLLKFKRVGSKNWGGRVTSCETWQANYNVTHWNHLTVF